MNHETEVSEVKKWVVVISTEGLKTDSQIYIPVKEFVFF